MRFLRSTATLLEQPFLDDKPIAIADCTQLCSIRIYGGTGTDDSVTAALPEPRDTSLATPYKQQRSFSHARSSVASLRGKKDARHPVKRMLSSAPAAAGWSH